MAELFPIDQIFDNPAYPGAAGERLIDAGIPAFTPEIGAPRILDLEMIPLFVEGTMNVLKHHGVIAGPMGRTGKGHRHLRRQQRAPGPRDPWRVRRAAGRAERQGRSRAEGRDPAQRLRRGRRGVHERAWPARSTARRTDATVRARQPAGDCPLRQHPSGGHGPLHRVRVTGEGKSSPDRPEGEQLASDRCHVSPG